MKRIRRILVPALLFAGVAVAVSASSHAAPVVPASATARAPEALAWCTKANAYGVRCDAPTQATETRDPVQRSLRYVGCGAPRSWMRWGNGMLYFCGRPLEKHERDIRAKYGITNA